jgi:hypothetical protein
VPGFKRLKEWAYAGLIIDLSGAVYSIYCSGKPASDWAPVFIPIILGLQSYVYYHKRQQFITLKTQTA